MQTTLLSICALFVLVYGYSAYLSLKAQRNYGNNPYVVSESQFSRTPAYTLAQLLGIHPDNNSEPPTYPYVLEHQSHGIPVTDDSDGVFNNFIQENKPQYDTYLIRVPEATENAEVKRLIVRELADKVDTSNLVAVTMGDASLVERDAESECGFTECVDYMETPTGTVPARTVFLTIWHRNTEPAC